MPIWNSEYETMSRDALAELQLRRLQSTVAWVYDNVEHYRKALERYPGYSQARYNMAVVLRKMGERAMAVENFRQFLQDDPFHPLARRAQEYIIEIEKEEGE